MRAVARTRYGAIVGSLDGAIVEAAPTNAAFLGRSLLFENMFRAVNVLSTHEPNWIHKLKEFH